MVDDLERELAVAAWIFAGLSLGAPWHGFVLSFNTANRFASDS